MNQNNRYLDDPAAVRPRDSHGMIWPVVSFVLISVGTAIGGFSLALVSNQFGNTDRMGLVLLACAVGIFTLGIGLLFLRWRYAVLVGVLAAPLAVVLLIALYWVAMLATALARFDHDDFALHGAGQILPAAQMEEMYEHCGHYITYGPKSVPVFNSVAFFGDRYQLTMQVPVKIDSKTSGTVVGEPVFYLNEVRRVNISGSGQVATSFSAGHEFGAAEWNRVVEANGDYQVLGISINPTAVPDFQKFIDASRPFRVR